MNPDAFSVMRSYPHIYFACHVEHRTRARSAHGLTGREAGILAHLGEPEGLGAGELARHLGVAPSSLSAILKRLEGQGLITLAAPGPDARRRNVSLTDAGRSAIVDDSVLDAARVEAVLALMDDDERRRAVEGLALLAAAAKRLTRLGRNPE